MYGNLPRSLRHIISNAEYYGPSLFLLATDVVTVYVFQEPSLLSSLQESGLTDVVLHALLVKEVKVRIFLFSLIFYFILSFFGFKL
jgi:E3 ubiquitin-protein ligase HUWE1